MAMCSALAAALLIYREGGISAITTLFKRSFDYTCITSSVWLLPMLLLQDSRRAARTSATGELILLEDQDRSLWNREQIAEGVALVQRAFSIGQVGPYTVQAAIAAVHAQAPTAAATDWN